MWYHCFWSVFCSWVHQFPKEKSLKPSLNRIDSTNEPMITIFLFTEWVSLFANDNNFSKISSEIHLPGHQWVPTLQPVAFGLASSHTSEPQIFSLIPFSADERTPLLTRTSFSLEGTAPDGDVVARLEFDANCGQSLKTNDLKKKLQILRTIMILYKDEVWLECISHDSLFFSQVPLNLFITLGFQAEFVAYCHL